MIHKDPYFKTSIKSNKCFYPVPHLILAMIIGTTMNIVLIIMKMIKVLYKINYLRLLYKNMSRHNVSRVLVIYSWCIVDDFWWLIMANSIRFHSTYEARDALFELCKLLARDRFQTWNTSKYMMSQLYDPPEEAITLCFLDEKCFNRLLSLV